MWPNITVTVRAHARSVGGLDDLHPARHRQLVRGDALAHAVVQHLRGRAGRGAEARGREALEHLRQRQVARHEVQLHGRVRVQVDLRRLVLRHPQPALVVLDRPVGVDARTACRSRWPRTPPPRARGGGTPPRRARRHPASAGPGRTRRTRSPTVQTFDTLMLRFTTNVTVSPASSRRSESAAWRMSSIASGRVSANSAVSSSSLSAPPPCARSIARRHEVAPDRALLAAPGRAARDERPVLHLDRVEHALLEPVRVHVLRVHAQALGERGAARSEPLAHLVDRRERMLRRDVVAVGREPAEVGGALVDERQPPVRQVRRDLDAHVRHQPAALAHERAHVVERDLGGPRGQRLGRRRRRPRSAPPRRSRRAPRRSSGGAARSSAGSPPGGARARRARRRAPRAPRRGPARSPRSRRGSRW